MCTYTNNLTHFSVFTGIGGIDLAAEHAGFHTVGQVELAEYQHQILCKHWPTTARWRDIRDVTEQSIKDAAIRHVTLLSGGFPCQPFSKAGSRKGTNDNRFLWPEMLRVLRLLQPTWLLAENVAGITSLEEPISTSTVENPKTIKRYYERILPNIIKDIEKEGYILPKLSDETPIICNIPACGVGANHRRERIFIIARRNNVADSNSCRHIHGQTEKLTTERPHAALDKPKSSSSNDQILKFWEKEPCPEPYICGMDDGISKRLDRIRCLGNAVVPQQVYPILKSIYDIETN